MTLKSTITINDGTKIPLIGFGTNVLKGPSGINDIKTALGIGYRLIDTAQSYGNEEEVGQAVKESGIAREEVFVTTKIDDENQGYQPAIESFNVSLKKLQLDTLDLLLIHWPNIDNFDRSIATWKALIDLKASGKVNIIGVSNFTPKLIQQTIDASGVVPSVNQVEFHPFLFQEDLLRYCQEKDILIEAYCPIARARKTDAPILQRLSKKYDKSPVQIILRWHIEHKLVPIPRSSDPDHIKANIQIFDFSLTDDEVAAMDALDEGYRIVERAKGPPSW